MYFILYSYDKVNRGKESVFSNCHKSPKCFLIYLLKELRYTWAYAAKPMFMCQLYMYILGEGREKMGYLKIFSVTF